MSLPIFELNKVALNQVSMDQDQVSEILDLAEVSGCAVHSIFTGSPMGVLSVEASNTENSDDFVPIDEYNITEAGKRLLNVEKTQYRYVRVRYIFTSGSGELTSRVSGKRI